jgi:hypothetical protein
MKHPSFQTHRQKIRRIFKNVRIYALDDQNRKRKTRLAVVNGHKKWYTVTTINQRNRIKSYILENKLRSYLKNQ